MKFLIILLVIVGIQAISGTEEEWDFDVSSKELAREHWVKYKSVFRKQYENEAEEHFRMLIFLDSVTQVKVHNEKYAQGLVSFTIGINQFSDMPHSEYLEKMTTYFELLNATQPEEEVTWALPPPQNVDLPDQLDWRTKGYVTDVKYQTNACQAGYAFAATGALEGQYFRKKGVLVSLSEQQIIDCSLRQGNQGCKGGDWANAYKYIVFNAEKGIASETAYPYKGRVDNCRYNPKDKAASMEGLKWVRQKYEGMLKMYLADIGPIAVSLDASKASFKAYKSGVYYEPACRSDESNHQALVVGYGSDPKEKVHKDFWIVKNSYGRSWGENGYMRLARNANDHCGIAQHAGYPVVV